MQILRLLKKCVNMMFQSQNRIKGLNGGNLKMIALFCMVIDHSAVALLLPLKDITTGLSFAAIGSLYFVLRFIGRISFPIFCYFIVEGYEHTHNKLKYAMRLLLLAFLSEVPFDMVLFHEFIDFRGQNVYWTLLAGLLAVWMIDSVDSLGLKKCVSNVLKLFLIIGYCYEMQFFFKSDYGAVGVYTIIGIFLTRKKSNILMVIGYIAALVISYFDNFNAIDLESVMAFSVGVTAVIIVAIIPHRLNGKAREMAEGCMMLSGYSPDEVFSLVDVFLISRYNGEKGRMNKWFFYLFYPVHLLILALICMAVKLY